MNCFKALNHCRFTIKDKIFNIIVDKISEFVKKNGKNIMISMEYMIFRIS